MLNQSVQLQDEAKNTSSLRIKNPQAINRSATFSAGKGNPGAPPTNYGSETPFSGVDLQISKSAAHDTAAKS